MRGAALALMGLFAAGSAHADAPEANPGRPSFSDNATTTARGAIEIETGALADPDAEGHATTFKYGITDRFDVRFTVGGPADPAGDVDGLNLLLKWTLQPPDENGAGIAIEPYVNFPAPQGDDREGAGVAFVFTGIAGSFQLDVNTVVDAAPAGETDYLWSVSPIATLGFPILGDLGGFLEVASTVPTAGEAPATTLSGAGLGYAPFPNLVLDASVHARTGGREEDAPDWLAQAGLTFAFWAGSR